MPTGRTMIRVTPFFLALLLCVWLSPTPAYAVVLEFHTPVTYNMQGGTASYQSKWTNDVKPLSQTHDVVALQEAGTDAPPSSTQIQAGQLSGYSFSVSRWDIGTHSGSESRPDYRYVYFLETDPNGHRVNLAIVIRQQADQFQLIQPSLPNGRPALGVRLGAMWFYTLHGLSGSGNDDRALLVNIGAGSGSSYWLALGDYNRDPASLAPPPGTKVYSSGQTTYIHGGEYDYAVSNDIVECGRSATNLEVRARVLPGRLADHFPVDLIPMPCPAKKTPSAKLPDKHLVIMPLGDSITAGFKSSDNTGYRKDLQTELEDTGISFRYVGSESIGNMTNPQNEGHVGFRIDQISGIATPAVSRWNPSLVLLHAGTNDMNQDYQFDSAQKRLQDLIYQIYAAAPDTTILVSKLILSTDPAVNTRIQSFNESTVQDVRGLQAQGKRIELVDMSEVTRADMADSLHPNDTGYQKMASAWDEAIVTALQGIDIASRSNIGPRGGPGPIPPVGNWIDQGIIAGGVGADPKTSSVHFADFNGDGKVDYLVVHENGSVDAWINAGGDKPGSSKPGWIALGQVAGGVGASGKNIQFADINGDGKADYLAVHDDGSVDAWLNAGGDTPGKHGWIPAGRIAGGVGAPGKNIQFADINGDGLADYLVVDPNTGAVDAWINSGGDSAGKPGWVAYGRIATGVRTSAQQSVTRFADLNNDGYADYIVISKVNGAVSAYINGGGQPKKWIWEPVGQVAPGYGVPSPYRQAEEADINGDGRADYLQVDEHGAVHAWLNNGRDQSHVAGWLPLGQIASGVITDPKNMAIAFGDLDGDGRADYFRYSAKLNKGFRDYTVNAWVNRGEDQSGHWTWIPQSQVGPLRDSVCAGTQYGMKFADITGDGKADYEAICGNIKVTAFAKSNGQGQPTFLNFIQFGPLGSPPSSLRIVDFNGDGKADFLLLMPNKSVLAYINEGFPKVNYIPNVASGVAPADKVRYADINGDGKADYLVVNDDGSVDAWLNAGGDAPGKPGWISLGRIAGGIKASGKDVQFADIDGDGRADYVLVNPANGALTVWINNGTDKPW